MQTLSGSGGHLFKRAGLCVLVVVQLFALVSDQLPARDADPALLSCTVFFQTFQELNFLVESAATC